MRIKLEASFQRDFKQLRKKYPSLPSDLAKLGESLKENPQQGEALGKDCFKVRMHIASKKTGKSGASRVITCVKILNDTVHLLKLYDKSDIDSISDALLKKLIENIDD
jgi:mRNA-degrading endonuclease RelE of RelBE toxin-antitoxin system